MQVTARRNTHVSKHQTPCQGRERQAPPSCVCACCPCSSLGARHPSLSLSPSPMCFASPLAPSSPTTHLHHHKCYYPTLPHTTTHYTPPHHTTPHHTPHSCPVCAVMHPISCPICACFSPPPCFHSRTTPTQSNTTLPLSHPTHKHTPQHTLPHLVAHSHTIPRLSFKPSRPLSPRRPLLLHSLPPSPPYPPLPSLPTTQFTTGILNLYRANLLLPSLPGYQTIYYLSTTSLANPRLDNHQATTS